MSSLIQKVKSGKSQDVNSEDLSFFPESQILKNSDLDTSENGLREIASGRVAVMIMAGGSASRLECEYPKGMFNPETGAVSSIFELFCEKLKTLGRFAAK